MYRITRRGKAVLGVATALLSIPMIGFGKVAPEPKAEALVVKDLHVEPETSKMYAKSLIKFYNWNQVQFKCLVKLWDVESHWNNMAYNHIAVRQNGVALHAKGIAQVLGTTSNSSPLQIKSGFDYIQSRYGKPCTAWNFHLKHGYY